MRRRENGRGKESRYQRRMEHIRTVKRPRPKAGSWQPPRRTGEGNIKAIALLGLAGVVALGLLTVSGTEPERPRTAGMCLEGDVLPAVEGVMIDATERFTRAEALRLAGEIRYIAKRLPVEGKLVIVMLRPDDKWNGHILFSKCKPDDGSGANGWTDNPRLLEENYRKTFEEPLESILEALPELGEAKSSPILGTLYDVSSVFETPAKSKRLTIVSDMLEYSDQMSMYRPYSWQSALRLPKVKAMQGRLSQIEVTVLLRIHRRAHVLQNTRHERFWQTYFNYGGAQSYRVQPL